jgi:hypothetical protein
VSALLPDTIVAERRRESGEAQDAAEESFRAALPEVDVADAEWRAPAGGGRTQPSSVPASPHVSPSARHRATR